MQRNLLQYGLQRSGTNFLESLIKQNYPDCHFINGENRNEINHKHFRLYNNKSCIPEPQFQNNLQFSSFADFEHQQPVKPDLYIVTTKDPYSWLVSYNNWSIKNNWPPHPYHYIEEYNLFYGKWMAFSKETNRVHFVRYIDLLQNALTEINRIGSLLKLPAIQSIKAPEKVYASRKFTGHKKTEFLRQAHLSNYTPAEIAAVNQMLDLELMKFLNYEMVTG